MTEQLTLTDIIKEIEAQEVPASRFPVTQHAQSVPMMASRESFGGIAVQEDDIHRMVIEAQRNVQLTSGFIGAIMGKLRGNDLARAQYKSMLARIDGHNASEEAKLALLLAVSLKVTGFKVAISGLEDMERFLARFDPNSKAGELGRALLLEFQDDLRQTVHNLTSTNSTRVTRVLGITNRV